MITTTSLETSRPWEEVVSRKKKPPTKTIRVPVEIARMIDACAGAEGMDTPAFVSEVLGPILRERIPKSVESLLGQDHSKRHKS
jgi:hypothetical protein